MGCKLVHNILGDNLAIPIKLKILVQFDPTIVLLGLLEIHICIKIISKRIFIEILF